MLTTPSEPLPVVAPPPAAAVAIAPAGPGTTPSSMVPMRNTSSAMPDLASPNVPALKARVHQSLSPEECAAIPLEELQFRQLRPGDYNEMIALHTEWFPVSYDENFYKKSVQGGFFTLVATHARGANGQRRVAREGGADPTAGTPAGEEQEEDLIGIITMSTNCEHHTEDIVHVLGDSCANLCAADSSRARDPPSTDSESGGSKAACGSTAAATGVLAYILTLGVCDGFRRRGLARKLLERSLAHVRESLPQVQAVYLHVVTYNTAAIELYESMRFTRIGQFNSFYFLHGKHYDSFLYALYVNGGHQPWRWRWKVIQSLLGYLSSFWKSVWRADGGGATPPSAAERPVAERPTAAKPAAASGGGVAEEGTP